MDPHVCGVGRKPCLAYVTDEPGFDQLSPTEQAYIRNAWGEVPLPMTLRARIETTKSETVLELSVSTWLSLALLSAGTIHPAALDWIAYVNNIPAYDLSMLRALFATTHATYIWARPRSTLRLFFDAGMKPTAEFEAAAKVLTTRVGWTGHNVQVIPSKGLASHLRGLQGFGGMADGSSQWMPGQGYDPGPEFRAELEKSGAVPNYPGGSAPTWGPTL